MIPGFGLNKAFFNKFYTTIYIQIGPEDVSVPCPGGYISDFLPLYGR